MNSIGRTMTLLTTEDLTKTYVIENQTIPILKAVGLKVPEGEFLVIQGSSGSGKTTLLSLLSGLDRPTSGKVFFQNQEISRLTEDELAPLRNTAFGFVFQSFHLVPALTALENVMFPAELNHNPDARDRAERLLSRVGLQHRRHSFPHQLSGGEKQRVALCRALINTPRVIFADEPTGNLDSENGRAVLSLISELRAEQGATLILVTHSPEIAAAADRILIIEDGRITHETHTAS